MTVQAAASLGLLIVVLAILGFGLAVWLAVRGAIWQGIAVAVIVLVALIALSGA